MRALAAVLAFTAGLAAYLYAYRHGVGYCGWLVVAGVVVAFVVRDD